MAFVPGTSSDDIIIPTANGNTYLGGAGSDTYIITKAVAAGATVVITDTEGANKIQLTDGLTVASSTFFADAAELTLSNGAKVQITGASKFTFDIGANLTSGDTADTPNQTYAQFANTLGVAALPTGNTSATGTPNFLVPTTGVTPTPTFTISGATTGAEGTSATYTVKLSSPVATGSTTVDYAITFANGASAADVTGALTGTLTFAANETSKTITVPLVLDSIAETTKESVVVTLSKASAGTTVGAANTATTEITEVPVTFTVTGSDSVFEGANATYTVTASRPVDVDTVVGFVVTPGDVTAANAGTSKTNLADFDQGAFNTFNATIKAGQTTATYTVSAKDDGLTELEETFSVTPTIAGATVTPKVTTLKDGNGSGGKIFTLTTGVDNGAAFTGTAGNDTFNATGATLTGLDQLDGNAGTDTLNVLDATGGNINFTLPTSIKNIEVFNVESVTGLNGSAADVSGFAGLTTANFTLNNLDAAEVITAAATTAVNVNGKVIDGAETLTVNGGSVVTVNDTVAAGKTAGTVLVSGTATTVSIAETLGAGATAGAMNVTDTGAGATKAGTLTSVTLDGAGAASTITSNALTNLTLKNIGAWTVSVTDTLTAHTTTGTTLALALSGTAAGAGLTDTNNTIAALNITTSTKDSALNITSTSLKTITVAGDKALDLSGSTYAALTSLTSAAGSTAGIKATVGTGVTVSTGDGADQITTGATTKAISTGAGDDTVTLTAVPGAGGSVNGGAGTGDTISISATDAATASGSATFAGVVTNFERVTLTGATNQTIDLKVLGNFNYVSTSGGNGLTLNNMPSGGTLKLTGAGTAYTVANADFTAATADVLNVALTDGSGAGVAFASTGLTAANVETVAITTADTQATPSGTFYDTFTLLGNSATTITVAGNAGLTLTATDTAATTIDASGITLGGFQFTSGALANAAVIKGSATGANTVNFSAATKAVTYTGGTGVDTVNASNGKNNVITTGDGNDAVTGTTGNNTVDTGNGNDTITFTTGNNTINAGAGNDTVTLGNGQNVVTLGTGTDSLVLTTAPTSGNAYTIVTDAAVGDALTLLDKGAETFTATKISLAGTAVFQDYLDAASAGDGSTNGAIKWFQFAGNTYVVEDVSAAPTFQNGADLVVQLSGVIDLSTATGAGTNIITLA